MSAQGHAAGCCLDNPIYQLGAMPVGGIGNMVESPATLAAVIRRTLALTDRIDAELREHHHLSYGVAVDRLRLSDEAERAAHDRADRPREAPWSVVARTTVTWLHACEFDREQIDTLQGFEPGTAAAYFARHPPHRHLRAIRRQHLAGATAQRIAANLGMSRITVRDIITDVLGEAPNVSFEDRRQAADFRPKVVALARDHITRRGEPDVALIIATLARDGYELSVSQVKNAVRDARKKGTLPPPTNRPHGRLS